MSWIRPSRAKAAKRKAESKVVADVRERVFRRDWRCRACAAGVPREYGMTFQEDQWAHLGNHRRFKTRGMAPEERHTTQGSMRLCDQHHHQYDHHTLNIIMLTEAGADGPVRFERDGQEFVERFHAGRG